MSTTTSFFMNYDSFFFLERLTTVMNRTLEIEKQVIAR